MANLLKIIQIGNLFINLEMVRVNTQCHED